MFWACEVPSALEATAVFMPMTRPELSTNGPPEFPGLMAASVWNMLVRFSVDGARRVAGLDRPALGRDDPLGDRRGAGREPERVADGHHGVPHLHVVGVAVGHRGQVGLVGDLQQGHVVGGIGVDQGGRQGLEAAVQGDGDGGGAGDDVVVGDHLAVRR